MESIRDYIQKDKPFYHIVYSFNLDSVLSQGLLVSNSKSREGICVIRDCDPLESLYMEIINRQMHTLEIEDDTTYTIFKIVPSEFGITVADIAPDPVTDATAKLQAYICKDLPVTEKHIIQRDIYPHFVNYLTEDIIRALSLYGYTRPAPPIVNNA